MVVFSTQVALLPPKDICDINKKKKGKKHTTSLEMCDVSNLFYFYKRT